MVRDFASNDREVVQDSFHNTGYKKMIAIKSAQIRSFNFTLSGRCAARQFYFNEGITSFWGRRGRGKTWGLVQFFWDAEAGLSPLEKPVPATKNLD